MVLLQIDWDESSPVPLRNRHVNAWQVELVGCPPILKRLKFSDATVTPMCSGDGMQGARHIGVTDRLPFSSSATTTFTTQLLFPPPSSSGGGSSEVVNPEEIGGSPPDASVNMPPSEWRIQLFGATIITSPVNGSSEEVNQVPDAVVEDGAAKEDASSRSALELRIGPDDGPNQNDSREEEEA